MGVVTVVCGPGVGGGEHGAGTEDGLALVGEVGHVGELVAVELEHVAEGGLVVPLTAKALGNVTGVGEENVDLSLGKKSLVGVGGDLGLVLGNSLSVVFEIVLGLGNALGELEDLETEGLDGNDLVGVDVDLLLVALLVGNGGGEVEVVDGVVERLRHDGTVVARLGLKVDSGGGDSKGCNSGEGFHF